MNDGSDITKSIVELELVVQTQGGIGIGLSPQGDGRVIQVKPKSNGDLAGVLEEDFLMGYRFKEEQPADWDYQEDGEWKEDTEFEGFTDVK